MESQLSDEELMRRTRAGDRTAFYLLYERYEQPVLSYLYRMQYAMEDVELMGQEAFLRAFRFAPTYRYPQNFSTWLFAITRNLAANWRRRNRLDRRRLWDDDSISLDGVGISDRPYQVANQATDDLEKQDQTARVLKGLESPPADQKEVVVLGIFQDLHYAGMEAITGTKALTLRRRVLSGLKRLYGGARGESGRRAGRTHIFSGLERLYERFKRSVLSFLYHRIWKTWRMHR